MSSVGLTIAVADYCYASSLVNGDVTLEGVNLQVRRSMADALTMTLGDPSVDGGELSFSRHLIRLASGDLSFVGLPFFAVRSFQHRCFYVRRHSGLQSLKQLEGKHVGIDEWPATGNTWNRAALREQGVPINRLTWWVGPVDDAAHARPHGDLPSYARPAPPHTTLRAMLLSGDVDALVCSRPPSGFYDAESAIVRLFADYQRAEREYYVRTGIFPAQHIVGVRRRTFERHPEAVRQLYAALEQSKALWQLRLREMPEMAPWLLTETENTRALLGDDWNPSGTEKNRKMVATLCDELAAQELIAQPLRVDTVFAEFEELMAP